MSVELKRILNKNIVIKNLSKINKNATRVIQNYLGVDQYGRVCIVDTPSSPEPSINVFGAPIQVVYDGINPSFDIPNLYSVLLAVSNNGYVFSPTDYEVTGTVITITNTDLLTEGDILIFSCLIYVE